MKTIETIYHVTCDTCGREEPVKYRTVRVSTGELHVICSACITVLANMDAMKLWDIALGAGMSAEGKRAMDMHPDNDDCHFDYEGYRYADTELRKDLGDLIKHFKFRNTEVEDARE